MSLLHRAGAVALIGFLSAAAARPQTPCAGPTPSDPASRRPRIGLALGGGGARGAAHIGVLKVLEELRIPIDCIAGTSMGSVVGGLYVVGYSPETLGKVIGTVDWTDLFIDRAPRPDTAFRQKQNDYFSPPGLKVGVKKGPSFALPTAFIAGRKLGFLLKTLTLPAAGIENFDELAIPFRAVGADARTGEAVALSTGSLPRAIRASMAIPLIFTPVEVEGRLLIDGGNAQNLPVETARAMGAEVVIAVDVGSSGEIPEEAPTSMGAMLGRLIDLPLLSNTLQSRKLADLLIIPNLRGFGTADFGKMAEIIPRGEAAARRRGEALPLLGLGGRVSRLAEGASDPPAGRTANDPRGRRRPDPGLRRTPDLALDRHEARLTAERQAPPR